MTVILAACAVSLVVYRLESRFVLLPLFITAGFMWAGPLVGIPLGVFGLCLPVSARRLLSNLRVRKAERAVLRGLEAMLERAHLSSQAAEVAAAGGEAIASVLDPGSQASWLSLSLQHVLDGSAFSGAPLVTSLAILLDEARARVELLHEMRSRSSALMNVTLGFVAVEGIVGLVVLSHPGWAELFRHGVGAGLVAWIVLSTTVLLGLPWLQVEVAAW